jgi:hypothetical protein
MCTFEKTQVTREILAYLAEHPDAADTLEGIAEWWLLEQQIKCSMTHVQGAVDELVADGLLIKRSSEGLPAYFCLNAGKSEKISDVLKQKPPRRGGGSES